MFEGNRAEVGGVIFSEFNSNITIINSTFVENNATSTPSYKLYRYCEAGGGVLYADRGSTVINIINSKFMANSAQDDGGAVYLWYTTNKE